MMQQFLVALRPCLLRRLGIFLGFLTLLTGLLALTAWNVTRSEALTQARQFHAHGELTTCLRYSLDHLQRRPWSQAAALLAAQCLSQLDYADAAEPYYQRAGQLDLNSLQTRAFGLVRGNHRQRAIEAYEQMTKETAKGGIVVDPAKAIPQAGSMEDYAKSNPGMNPGASSSKPAPKK